MHRSRDVAAIAFAALAMAAGCGKGADTNDDMTEQRNRMVREQVQARGISDPRVLQAMHDVKRHLFVSREYADDAYEDHPLPIGNDQTISQPYIVALMTELLAIKPTDRVLEIGTGSGYQAAVLSLLADSVYSMEIIPALGEAARQRLDLLGYENVHVRIGDGYKGWPEEAPFNGIIVTAAPPEIPQALLDQLADGGRMVVPVGTGYQELMLLEKKQGVISKRVITAVRFVPMVKGKETNPQP
ncbi:MAG TPA: protein-L-isoaspartate(D-aspartate) O-methyltransferase [Candidatus Krumholzibacteria bacterium]|nr:protein-L-isoaspartate(D-aspartate) O-methyltransferase [Candidatus Krumholzibacteria bacterium]